MGKYLIVVTDKAKKHMKAKRKAGDTLSVKKIKRIISELSQNPYTGIGKPEALKYQLQGYWSRQINKKDRLIYQVDEETATVTIVSGQGHYFDK